MDEVIAFSRAAYICFVIPLHVQCEQGIPSALTRPALPGHAVRAGAAQFDGGLGKLEAVVVRPALEAFFDRGVRKFVDLAAVLADREGDNAVLVPMRVLLRMGAGDEGVEAFQPVDQAHVDQLFQRTIDLKWRAKTVLAQLVE
ncbi:hypothetical protein C7374_11716 [Falsochrobactrum ovis]|uniref:Uncharacterized protein n=1 Tax=Falsochrobactrum ovis TaxID=1293442 RepID=A0A364JSB0_9HYPH|nr:hypothetical protein C7374_11716 [Falsochrobactrum ovis]